MTIDSDLEINKGTELMLRRRAKREPQMRGLKIHKILALQKKIFHFKLEITWEESAT